MKKTIIFRISGMHCSACAMDIDGVLEDTAGVVSATTNYAKAETKVEFDANKVDEQKILALVKEAGYEAEFMTMKYEKS